MAKRVFEMPRQTSACANNAHSLAKCLNTQTESIDNHSKCSGSPDPQSKQLISRHPQSHTEWPDNHFSHPSRISGQSDKLSQEPKKNCLDNQNKCVYS